MERRDAIQNAYRLTGSNSFYDGMITCSTVPGKAVCRLVWGMNKQECDEYGEKAMAGIPENFSGRLLEVPVGTGILTMPLYKTLPQADITCLDYSPDMMGQAREKAEKLGVKNVSFRQGDVGALPYEDGSLADWTSRLGPVLGREAALSMIQDQYSRLALPMLISYAGMFMLALTGVYAILSKKTILPRWMLAFNMIVLELVFVLIPDVRQLLVAGISTWDFVLSQCSGNAALFIWMTANAVWAGSRKETDLYD